MVKAVLLDYTGTILQEKGEDIEEMVREVVKSSDFKTPEAALSWWFTKLKALEEASYGENFMNEDEMCLTICDMAEKEHHLRADHEKLHRLNQNMWMYAPLFEDAEEFLRNSPVPVYIVTNNDAKYVSIRMHSKNLHPNGVISASDAGACKPHSEIFETATARTGVPKEELLLVGDSLTSDVQAAASAGIPAILLDRNGSYENTDVQKIGSLTELYDILK